MTTPANRTPAAPSAEPASEPIPIHHVPLSVALTRLLDSLPPDRPLTLNWLLERTDGRGIYLILILLNVPFLIPLPFFGLSTPVGMLMALLGLKIAFGATGRLPGRIGRRELPAGFRDKVMGRSIRILRRLERWVKPRRDTWLAHPSTRMFNGLLLVILALLISLPIPPVVPFTNTIPAYCVILISLSMMEEDGVLIWWAYAAFVAVLVFFALIFIGSGALIIKYWRTALDMIQSAL